MVCKGSSILKVNGISNGTEPHELCSWLKEFATCLKHRWLVSRLDFCWNWSWKTQPELCGYNLYKSNATCHSWRMAGGTGFCLLLRSVKRWESRKDRDRKYSWVHRRKGKASTEPDKQRASRKAEKKEEVGKLGFSVDGGYIVESSSLRCRA